MLTRRTTKRPYGRKAAVMLQAVLFGSTVGVGVAALAVDTGLMYASKAELQNAADSAALAAVSRLVAETNAMTLAAAEAATFTQLHRVAGDYADVIEADIVPGHAVLVTGDRFEFQANQTPYDAIRVTLRRDQTAADGPVSLLFGKALGVNSAQIRATATAMLSPRDIAVSIDLSRSMNDDTELRHYTNYTSENDNTTRPGVKINLEDTWLAFPCEKGNNGVGNGIDPQPPGNPQNYNDQPGTGPGQPNSQGGNPSPGADPQGGANGCTGPRWGWMTGFGNEIVLGSYTPVGDPGLYYIPRYATCTDPDVINNITENLYNAEERAALLSGANDATDTYYFNRVKVLLGLAGWRSKKPDGKYNGGPGNHDDIVNTNELHQQASWPFGGGSWSDWVSYNASNATMMYATDSNFRYRYGIKTVMNYLLERQAANLLCPELADAPEMPLHSVKNAVQTMVDKLVELDTQDQLSLEVFATTGRHEVDLVGPSDSLSALDAFQAVADTLRDRQAGHYDSTTCIGCGVDEALAELTSSRARTMSAKVIILLTDGKPNVSPDGGDAEQYCLDVATEAAEMGATLYTIGVGADVKTELLEQMAEIGHGEYFFADSTPDEVTGQPKYVEQLTTIFNNLGTKRPPRLIQ
ncbi:MAG TPA: VWA domain-containing protein [Phycisphaerae bacterium]|nr:VWA domain-containing protein [Phycisphaerae bacterium]